MRIAKDFVDVELILGNCFLLVRPMECCLPFHLLYCSSFLCIPFPISPKGNKGSASHNNNNHIFKGVFNGYILNMHV